MDLEQMVQLVLQLHQSRNRIGGAVPTFQIK